MLIVTFYHGRGSPITRFQRHLPASAIDVGLWGSERGTTSPLRDPVGTLCVIDFGLIACVPGEPDIASTDGCTSPFAAL